MLNDDYGARLDEELTPFRLRVEHPAHYAILLRQDYPAQARFFLTTVKHLLSQSYIRFQCGMFDLCVCARVCVRVCVI